MYYYEEEGYSVESAEEEAYWTMEEYFEDIDQKYLGSTQEERDMLFMKMLQAA